MERTTCHLLHGFCVKSITRMPALLSKNSHDPLYILVERTQQCVACTSNASILFSRIAMVRGIRTYLRCVDALPWTGDVVEEDSAVDDEGTRAAPQITSTYSWCPALLHTITVPRVTLQQFNCKFPRAMSCDGGGFPTVLLEK